MERGFVSAIAMNGAGMIHDFEVALAGATSEEVDSALGPGQFGMAEETGQHLNDAIASGASRKLGLGQAASEYLAATTSATRGSQHPLPGGQLSIPITVHVGIGTDIIHMHPSASGEAIGAASLRDFRYFTSFVAELQKGVYLNCGSAVILPEVLLKAVSLVRNRGISLDGLTTVNLDFVRLYRPETNVVRRPVAGIGRGYSITGHHEILIPLLAAASDRGIEARSVQLRSGVRAGVAQWLEHAAHIRSVRGSSPCTGTNSSELPANRQCRWLSACITLYVSSRAARLAQGCGARAG